MNVQQKRLYNTANYDWPTLAKDSIIIFHKVLPLTIFLSTKTFYDYSCLADTLIIQTAAKSQGKNKLQTFD